MDIINKGMAINLPFVSLRSAMIHVVDVGNVQLPVSLKVIKHTFTKNFASINLSGICHRMLRNYCRRLNQLCLAVASTEKKMSLEIHLGKLIVLVYPFQVHQNSLKKIFLDG